MKLRILIFVFVAGLLFSCKEDDNSTYTPEKVVESKDPISVYFRENFLVPYGTAVRWKWVDKFVDDSKRVTPPLRDVCMPMGEFVKEFWLEPFMLTQDGQKFMKEHFPPEIVFIGSKMYNSDGKSITLGYADAGARITFTEVNDLNLKNKSWLLKQLRTADHEYGHIIHQKHNLPNGYKEVTPKNYKSNNWLNLDGDVQKSGPKISREAISLGMVSNYGTSNEQEDFCELLSIYITSDSKEFDARYIIHEPEEEYAKIGADGKPVLGADGKPIMLKPAKDAKEMNKGRDFIAIKLKLIKDYYKTNFNIDLDAVRDEIIRKVEESLK